MILLTGAQHDGIGFNEPFLAAGENMQSGIVDALIGDPGNLLDTGPRRLDAVHPAGGLAQ